MGLFNFHFDRPGPGVSPDAPRKKGPARFFEILGRDLMSFYLAGLLALVSALPFVFGVWFAVDTHSLVPLLLAGVLGGMIEAPQLCGLLDTILRSRAFGGLPTAAPGNVTPGRRFCRALSAVCCWPCRSLRCSIMMFLPV